VTLCLEISVTEASACADDCLCLYAASVSTRQLFREQIFMGSNDAARLTGSRSVSVSNSKQLKLTTMQVLEEVLEGELDNSRIVRG